MPTRRDMFIGAAALSMVAALPAAAQDRPNPMPEDLRRALERDPTAPVLGNPQGNITLTQFFDYNCGYCRTMLPLMSELVQSDPDLRVVYREWPVFGQGSEYAARMSLAALDTGDYWRLHAALLSMRRRAEQASVLRVVRDLGLDEQALLSGMDADRVEQHIASSFLLADHMGLMGTPTFICGDEAVFGSITAQELRDLVARGRQTMGV